MRRFSPIAVLICLSLALATCKALQRTGDPTPAPLPDGVTAPTAEELQKARERAGWGVINLNGHPTIVRWSDGDSFRFKSGEFDDNSVRLKHYNTLESYGPVHRWGEWTGDELFAIAKSSRFVAAEGEWNCTTDGIRDGYGRVLVDCPDVAEHMVREGHGHAFSMESTADPKLLKVQARAQKDGAGMWAKGVPPIVITSLHSFAEDYARKKGTAYNRTVSAKTGESVLIEHTEIYDVCQEVCEGAANESVCMTYVPFEIRYRNKPECLWTKKKKRD